MTRNRASAKRDSHAPLDAMTRSGHFANFTKPSTSTARVGTRRTRSRGMTTTATEPRPETRREMLGDPVPLRQSLAELAAVENDHDCPGPRCHPYPSFGDDPGRWGLLLGAPMTEAEAAAAEELEMWGPRGTPSWSEWAAEAGS